LKKKTTIQNGTCFKDKIFIRFDAKELID